MANAVEHAYSGGAPGPVRVVVRRDTPTTIIVQVQDHGSWSSQTPPRDRGRGTSIMQSSSDGWVRTSSADGTETSMSFLVAARARS